MSGLGASRATALRVGYYRCTPVSKIIARSSNRLGAARKRRRCAIQTRDEGRERGAGGSRETDRLFHVANGRAATRPRHRRGIRPSLSRRPTARSACRVLVGLVEGISGTPIAARRSLGSPRSDRRALGRIFWPGDIGNGITTPPHPARTRFVNLLHMQWEWARPV
jgi:hypothetical protein